MTDVAVVGSINHDLTVITRRHPLPGETVLGEGHFEGGGGKGANQAVAAARLGATVAMVGRVGADANGRALQGALRREGVDTSHLVVDDDSPTGMALITLDRDAENTIVVSPGANSKVSPGQLENASRLLGEAKVVLCQLEIPIDAVEAAARLCAGILCLNPAPGMELSGGLLDMVDVLVPNQSELSILTGEEVTDHQTALAAARRVEGPGAVVVTLGAEGALVVEEGKEHSVEPLRVDAVDTTGAGDAFCGGLAVALARGETLVEAVRWAMVSGALATTARGAQASMPTSHQVESFVAEFGLPEAN